MALPTLSVVVANYNHGRFLPAALRCLLAQSVRPLEILVIDDGSTDDSRRVAAEFARSEPIVKLLPNSRNQGVTYSFNRGLALARGEYVYGAAADDQVLPEFFAECLTMAAQYPRAGIVFGDVVKVDNDGNALAYYGLSRCKEKRHFTAQAFLDDYLGVEAPGHSLCGATIYRRDRLLELGGYRDGLGPWVDTFVTRAIGLKYGACYIPKPFMQWRYSPGSLANRTTTWEALRIARRAARQMRSRRFRECFPEAYVRSWEMHYRTFLLREHLNHLPQRREALLEQMENRIGRCRAILDRIKSSPILGFPLRTAPWMERWFVKATSHFLRERVERRLRAEERYLYRRLDPVLRRANIVRRLCELIGLPAVSVPLPLSAIAPDGGHGFRVDLACLRLFAPSDQESASLLRILEDGKPLAHPHVPHDAIRATGCGRYSHWGNFLYFASSDNSDPRHNGRSYVIAAPRTLLSSIRSAVQDYRSHKAA